MSSSTPVRSNLIGQTEGVLVIGDLHLLLPQKDIRAVEAAADVDTQAPEAGSVGWMDFAGQSWPVYCLSSDLAMLTDIPVERRSCVLLGSTNEYKGLLCNEVSLAQQVGGARHELPDVMRSAYSPVISMLLQGDDALACVTTAELLMKYISHKLVGG